MATEISERQAREVAEAAREQEWKLPSFGKELFLGNFRLDLIAPQPKLGAQAVEKGERFLARLRTFLEEEVDPLEIEREAKISDRVLDGLKEIGALGMKVPEQYGGSGSRRSTTTARSRWPASGTPRSPRCSPRTSRSGSPSRCSSSARRSRSSAGCRSWPGTTSPRSCSRSPTSAPIPPGSRRPPRRTATSTCSTASSCGRPPARSPTSSS
jgi:hypothetical protein